MNNDDLVTDGFTEDNVLGKNELIETEEMLKRRAILEFVSNNKIDVSTLLRHGKTFDFNTGEIKRELDGNGNPVKTMSELTDEANLQMREVDLRIEKKKLQEKIIRYICIYGLLAVTIICGTVIFLTLR